MMLQLGTVQLDNLQSDSLQGTDRKLTKMLLSLTAPLKQNIKNAYSSHTKYSKLSVTEFCQQLSVMNTGLIFIYFHR